MEEILLTTYLPQLWETSTIPFLFHSQLSSHYWKQPDFHPPNNKKKITISYTPSLIPTYNLPDSRIILVSHLEAYTSYTHVAQYSETWKC